MLHIGIVYIYVANQPRHTDKICFIIYYCYSPNLSVTFENTIRVPHNNRNSKQQLHKLHNEPLDITASTLSNLRDRKCQIMLSLKQINLHCF
jgi:hypothetical protein